MDLTQLYETRMLIFIETGPQTNKYRQVIVNNDQFKAISDIISTKIDAGKDKLGEYETMEIELSDEIYPLADLQSFKHKQNNEEKSNNSKT